MMDANNQVMADEDFYNISKYSKCLAHSEIRNHPRFIEIQRIFATDDNTFGFDNIISIITECKDEFHKWVKDINNNKYYYISNNTKSYNVYISKIYDYNEEDMLVFNPMEYNIDIEKFLDIINNVKFKENKDADYYIIQK